MDIPINAEVHCRDGRYGLSTFLIVNPITKQVTDVVVREMEPPHEERVVPIGFISDATPEIILLTLDRDEASNLRPFFATEYINSEIPDYRGQAEEYVVMPYVEPLQVQQRIKTRYRDIPPGELAVGRGAEVEATDGRVGRIDEFMVDRENGHITHLVLREGHLWGDEEIAIPVADIGRIEEGIVHLRIDRAQIEALPAIKVRRHWL